MKTASPFTQDVDGFHVSGSNVTIVHVDLNNGDDEVAVGARLAPSSNLLIENSRGYGRNGFNIADATYWGVTNVTMQNISQTAGVVQYDPAAGTLNGMTLAQIQAGISQAGYTTGLPSLTDALPTVVGHTNGFLNKMGNERAADESATQAPNTAGGIIANVLYNNICMKDLNGTIGIQNTNELPSGDTSAYPQISQNFTYKNIEIAAPTNQLVNSSSGVAYTLYFDGYAPIGSSSFNSTLSLQNFYIDDPTPGLGTGTYNVTFQNDNITSISGNLYPSYLANLTNSHVKLPSSWSVSNVTEASGTVTSNTLPGICNANSLPYMNAEAAIVNPIGGLQTEDLLSMTVTPGSTVNVEGIVQPSIPEVNNYWYFNYNGANTFMSVAAPRANTVGAVTFYLGGNAVCSGTQSSLDPRIWNCSFQAPSAAGQYILGVQYADQYYNYRSDTDPYAAADQLPALVVSASSSASPAAASIALSQSAASLLQYQVDSFTAALTASSGQPLPTGTVTFTEGASNLGTATLVNGVASLSVPMVQTGTQTVIATYSGDANYLTNGASINVSVKVPSVTAACFASPH